MTEVLFYHLERKRLEDVLPGLVQKTLQRGWKAVVQATMDERVKAISDRLWEWRDDEFLAHGTPADGAPRHQPVWITTQDENPNGANIRFLVDGADCASLQGLDRLIVIFDGNDQDAVVAARARWKSVQEAGHDATYWQQDERGKWVKRA